MIDLKNLLSKINRVAVINYIGCIFIVVGIALPWPCLASRGYECAILQTNNLSDSWLGILLVITVFLIPIGVRVFNPPVNYIYWFAFWLVIYVLLVPWLYPVYMDKEVWGYLPLIGTNQDMSRLTHGVFQLGLVAYWLNIRPAKLQGMIKFAAYFSLAILALLTLIIYIPLEIRVTEMITDPSRYSDQAVLGVGPLSIILGCLLLLGTALYFKIPEKKILKKD